MGTMLAKAEKSRKSDAQENNESTGVKKSEEEKR